MIIVLVPKAPFPLWENHQTKCRTDLHIVTAEVKIALEEMRAGTRNLRGNTRVLALKFLLESKGIIHKIHLYNLQIKTIVHNRPT